MWWSLAHTFFLTTSHPPSRTVPRVGADGQKGTPRSTLAGRKKNQSLHGRRHNPITPLPAPTTTSGLMTSSHGATMLARLPPHHTALPHTQHNVQTRRHDRHCRTNRAGICADCGPPACHKRPRTAPYACHAWHICCVDTLPSTGRQTPSRSWQTQWGARPPRNEATGGTGPRAIRALSSKLGTTSHHHRMRNMD